MNTKLRIFLLQTISIKHQDFRWFQLYRFSNLTNRENLLSPENKRAGLWATFPIFNKPRHNRILIQTQFIFQPTIINDRNVPSSNHSLRTWTTPCNELLRSRLTAICWWGTSSGSYSSSWPRRSGLRRSENGNEDTSRFWREFSSEVLVWVLEYWYYYKVMN